MNSNSNYIIESELFVIPHGDDYILYAPLRKSVLLVNTNLVNFLCDIKQGKCVDLRENGKLVHKLTHYGIINKNLYKKNDPRLLPQGPSDVFFKEFLPTHLTLFLTSRCNLACKYCYGNGGDQNIDMPMYMGKDAIDLLFLNAAKSRSKHVELSFHGGGEPVLKLRTMKGLIEHSRNVSCKRGVKLTLGLTTNCTMTDSTCKWVVDNINNLNVSCDGPADIQNYQRPMKNGTGSFEKVFKNLRLLEKFNKKYSIRVTVTKYSQDRIDEIVDFLTMNFSPTAIQAEPVFYSPRTTRYGIDIPEGKVFVRSYLRAENIANKRKVNFSFSGYRFPKLSNTFCGIGFKNFSVTPQGNVTSCHEVLFDTDNRSDVFFYGKYLPKKGFILDPEKVSKLRKLSLQEFKFCHNCFAKFHCAGDCRAKALYFNEVENFRGTVRCEITKRLIKSSLINQLHVNERC